MLILKPKTMRHLIEIRETKNQREKRNIRWSLSASKKLLGLGLMIDTYPPIADRRKWFQAEFKLLFVEGWIVVYKTK